MYHTRTALMRAALVHAPYRAASSNAHRWLAFGASESGQALDPPPSPASLVACLAYASVFADGARLFFAGRELASPLRDIPIDALAAGRSAAAFVQGGRAFYIRESGAIEPISWDSADDAPVDHVAMGWDHGHAVTRAGAVRSFGRNTDGQLGAGAAGPLSVEPSSAIALAKPIIAKHVLAGGDFSLVLGSDGEVALFGNGEYGQTLSGRAVFAEPVARRSAELAALGDMHALALGVHHGLAASARAPARVFAWGWGALGPTTVHAGGETGAWIDLPEPVIALAAGSGFSFAVGKSRRAYSWGFTANAALARSVPAGAIYDPVPQLAFGGARVERLFVGPLHGWALVHD